MSPLTGGVGDLAVVLGPHRDRSAGRSAGMIVAVGDLATDIVVQLSTATIDPVSDTPALITRHRGGAAANVATVSARLGRPARFVGPVGRDSGGRWLVEQLGDLGVAALGPLVEVASTIVVLVDPDGARRFLTDPGSPPTSLVADPSLVAGASRVHLSGYAVCDPLLGPWAAELGSIARRLGLRVSVDPASTSTVSGFGIGRLLALLDDLRPDVVHVNEDESELLTLGALVDRCGVVVETRGAAPTRVHGRSGAGAWTREFDVDLTGLAVCDTTGAGDAFTAGFLREWDAGRGLESAVAAGHAAARAVVGGAGADAWETPTP
jgi:sugar/nucleoside kinase (ribokinase family)